MTKHEGTRATDVPGDAFKRTPLGPKLYPWAAMIALAIGALSWFSGYSSAQGAQKQEFADLKGKVAEHSETLKQMPTANNRLTAIEVSLGYMSKDIKDMRDVLLPRNPTERVNLVTRDTRKP